MVKKFKKKMSNQAWSNWPLLALVIVIIGIIAFFIFIGLSNNKSTLYAPDKSEVEQSARQVVGSFVGRGTTIQDTFVDDGCTEGDVGWLGTYVGCAFIGQKYFKADGDVSTVINELDTDLRALGYRMLDRSSNAPTSQSDDLIKGLATAEQRGSLRYQSSQGLTVTVYLFKADASSTLSAKDYLDLPTNVSLGQDEFIYGVKVRAPYWECSQSCPEPPAPVRRP